MDFVTNGWLLKKNFIDELIEKTNIIQFMVSVDANEEIHDNMRNKKGAFRCAMNGVKYAVSKGFEVTVTATLQRSTIDDIEVLIDKTVEAGAQRMKIRPLVGQGRAFKNLAEEGFTLAEIESYQTILKRKVEEYADRLSIVHQMPVCELGVCACDYNPTEPGAIANNHGTCGIGRMLIYLRYDKGVTPTTHLRDFIIGNIEKQKLLSIWQDEEKWLPVRPPNRHPDNLIAF